MKRLFLTAAIVFLSLTSHATGPGEGGGSGGGKGVVCRDSSGGIKSVELLDLWEARTIYQRTINESNEPVEIQAERAAKALMNGMSYWHVCTAQGCLPESTSLYGDLVQIQSMFIQRMANIKFLKGVNLALTNDSYEVATPASAGCQPEQIVRYEDTPGSATIYVNEDILEKMSNTQVAALITHEGLYKVLRRMDGEQNSVRVRRAIGGVFAGLSFPDAKTYQPTNRVICTASGPTFGDSTRIEIFNSPLQAHYHSNAIVHVSYIHGRYVFGGNGAIGQEHDRDLTSAILKGQAPHSKDVFMSMTQGMAWDSGNRTLDAWIHDIENETDIRINYIQYKDGAVEMIVPEFGANQPPSANPQRMKCHAAGPNDT